MKHGQVVEHGTYRELLARGVDFHAELDGPQPAEPTTPSTPKAPDMPDASPAGTPVTSATADSTGSSGGSLIHALPAKLGRTPPATVPKSAALASTMKKGDLIKVGAGLKLAEHMQQPGDLTCSVMDTRTMRRSSSITHQSESGANPGGLPLFSRPAAHEQLKSTAESDCGVTSNPGI